MALIVHGAHAVLHARTNPMRNLMLFASLVLVASAEEEAKKPAEPKKPYVALDFYCVNDCSSYFLLNFSRADLH